MTLAISAWQLAIAVVGFLLGNAYLGRWLLQRSQQKHEAQLARVRADLEAEIRGVQANLDRQRARHDDEVAQLRDVWGAISSLRITLDGVAAAMGTRHEDPQRARDALSEMMQARNYASRLVGDRQPFLPADVHRKAWEVVQMTTTWLVPPEPLDAWLDELRAHRERFVAACEHLVATIRARVGGDGL